MAREAAPPGITANILHDPSEDQLAQGLSSAEVLISERSGSISAAMLDQAPHLKLIVRLGSLSHDIDLDACREKGVIVCRQPVIQTSYVAEHILMMMLALSKRLRATERAARDANHGQSAARTDENTFRYNWFAFSGIGGLINRTVAVIGMGEIGVELARRLRGFSPQMILYHKRNRFPPFVEDDLRIHFDESGYQRADFVVNLLPYAPATDLRLDERFFQQMKPGAFLIHAGSGSTLDESALVGAIESGHLGGAALDTFEYEPLQKDHPLVELARDPAKNVILTPHIAAGTVDISRERDYDEVLRFLNGEPLRYRIV
jgi:lactate dehydrogenase-like 2-hydroxyacid dehydrogenase